MSNEFKKGDLIRFTEIFWNASWIQQNVKNRISIIIDINIDLVYPNVSICKHLCINKETNKLETQTRYLNRFEKL